MAHDHSHGSHGHHVAHHFPNAEIQFEAAKQGMWLFLVTEVLMFGGLFVAYGLFRSMYPEVFHAAHKLLDVKMGAINTVILITSSLTMVLGVTATQRGHKDRAFWLLGATFLLACGFLVVKYFEYTHKFHLGIFPAGMWAYQGTEFAGVERVPLFFSIYFVMTGLHGVHVLIGMGLIAWLMILNRRNRFSPAYYTPVEMVGFYWHFVDLVWIYLFPLLYLVS